MTPERSARSGDAAPQENELSVLPPRRVLRPGSAGDHFLYFAYGSNMATTRLTHPERAPSARAIGRAQLRGHFFAYRKRSRDGSSKADAPFTNSPGDVIEGVVFRISEDDRDCLEQAEGAGPGSYDPVEVTVRYVLGAREARCLTYLAAEDAITDLPPYDWYVQYVLDGAAEHGLPEAYVARFLRVRGVPGPPELIRPCRARSVPAADMRGAEPVNRSPLGTHARVLVAADRWSMS